MRSKRICLITALHPSANPRLVKEADALVGAGYMVDVIAPYFSPLWGAADERLCNRGWRIVARPRFGPHSPRMTRMRELCLRLMAHSVARGLRLTYPAIVRAACHPIAPALVTAAKRVKADFYIAHLTAALPAAAIAAREHDALFAFDAEDFHLGDLPSLPQHDYARQLVRRIEGDSLPSCNYVTAASPLIAEAYAAEYEIPVPRVVLNVFPRSHAPGESTIAGSARPGPSIYWFSQTIGPDRGLECLVDAIAQAQSHPHLYLRGNPTKGYAESLLARAHRTGVADRVHILNLIQQSELERAGAAFDVGYIGELAETRNRQIALTNKLFSYLLSGIAIVASDIPSHRQIQPQIREAMSLFRPNDAVSLAVAIDFYLLDGARLSAARHHAWLLGQEKFNWDLHKSSFLDAVEGAFRVGAGNRATVRRGRGWLRYSPTY